MIGFIQQYGTEAKCYRALYHRARLLKGFSCPACGDRQRSYFRRGQQVYYPCRICRHPMTLIGGAVFEATKINMAALGLMRRLGVNDKAA